MPLPVLVCVQLTLQRMDVPDLAQQYQPPLEIILVLYDHRIFYEHYFDQSAFPANRVRIAGATIVCSNLEAAPEAVADHRH